MNIKIIIQIIICSTSIIASASNADESKKCIQPRYAREALMTLYLQQKYPEIPSELPIYNRIRTTYGEKITKEISDITTDVLICFNVQSSNSCPENKKFWSRHDHVVNGWKTLDKYKDKMTLSEQMYLSDQNQAWVEESECSDF